MVPKFQTVTAPPEPAPPVLPAKPTPKSVFWASTPNRRPLRLLKPLVSLIPPNPPPPPMLWARIPLANPPLVVMSPLFVTVTLLPLPPLPPAPSKIQGSFGVEKL